MSANTHAELMRQMGTPKGDGFDPMPPRQHASFLDIGESEQVRVIAWIWSKTIHPGKGRKRSYFARDQRGTLTLSHMAADLNMALSNLSSAFKRTVEMGRARKDEKGRICLCGDVPDPKLAYDDQEGRNKSENDAEIIFLNKLSASLRYYFQQLPKGESQRRIAEYLQVREYREKIEADAIKAARDAGQKFEDEYLAAIGFTSKEPRGRPKKDRTEPSVQLSILRVPALSVQINGYQTEPNYVQKEESIPYEIEIGDVQKSASLLNFSEFTELSEKDIREPSSSSLASEIPPTTTTIPEPDAREAESLARLAAALQPYGTPDQPLVRKLWHDCRKNDPGATAEEVCQVIVEKAPGKRNNGLGYFLTAIPPCFPLPRAATPPPKPAQMEQETEFQRRWREEQERNLADPKIPEQEKHLIRLSLGIAEKEAGA